MPMRPAVLATIKASLESEGYIVVERAETTSAEVASIAGRGMADPASLNHEEIRSVCASAVTQAADKIPTA